MLTLDEKLDSAEFRRVYGNLWALTHACHDRFLELITFKQFKNFQKYHVNLGGLTEKQFDKITVSNKLKRLWIKTQIINQNIEAMEKE